MNKIREDGVCPFCPENLKDYHDKPILENREHWIITENAYPYQGAETHLLFILKRHTTHMNDLSGKEWSKLKESVDFFVQKYNLEGATILMRFGNTNRTGGTVSHLHAQLIAGNSDSDAEVTTRVA